MSSKEQYQYTPLSSPDSFRLILLHPAPFLTDPLKCTLIHSSLLYFNTSLVDHYTTLSYVWGNASSTRLISINNKAREITTSLDTALRHMRHAEQEMKVWADGICINQASVEDKNNQVRLMGVIYGLAHHTIIFLGETTPECDAVFAILEIEKGGFDEKMKSGFLSNVLRESPSSSQDTQSTDWNFMNLIDNHVLNRKWFSRTWILQELVLSGDPWLQIGRRRVRWSTFSTRIMRNWKPLEAGYQNVKSMLAMHTLRSEFVSSQNAERQVHPCDFLLQILHSRRGSGVFDARDMLYAHLGMHRSGAEDQAVERLIRVDYQKSVVDVYTDLALYIFRNQRGFGFLSHVEDRPLEDRSPVLPSWVPDWTSPFASPDAQFHFTDLFKMGSVDRSHVVVGDSKILGCVGDVIGQIEYIIEDRPTAEQVEMLCNFINPEEDDDEKVHYSEDEDSASEDATYDEDENQKPNAHELKILYQALYQHLRSWVGEQHLPDWDDILFKEDDDLEAFSKQSKARTERTYPKIDPTNLVPQDPYTRWWTTRDGRYKPEKQLIRQLLMTITKGDVDAFLAGKKLAFLDNQEPGAIALVPTSSQIGDFVCKFNHNRSVPYVLRTVENLSPEVDDVLIEFFEKGKNEVRDRFVEYTEEGEIIWKMDGLADAQKVMLVATTELWSEYQDERDVLYDEGLRLRQQGDEDVNQLTPEIKAQLKNLSDNVMRAMDIASEEKKVTLWSSYIAEKDALLIPHQHERASRLEPNLRRKLDELSSKVIRATNLASEEEVLLQQIDTSEVNHVQVVGEAIVDYIDPDPPSEDEDEHQIREFKDRDPQFIIALH